MCSEGSTYTAPLKRELCEPKISRHYFTRPGFIKQPASPVPYLRQPGIMHTPQFKPELIRQLTLMALRTDYRQLMSKSRELEPVDNRCILAWLCYKYSYSTGMKKIGQLIGRDRTTAIHMVDRANNAILTGEPNFISKLERVELMLLNL